MVKFVNVSVLNPKGIFTFIKPHVQIITCSILNKSLSPIVGEGIDFKTPIVFLVKRFAQYV